MPDGPGGIAGRRETPSRVVLCTDVLSGEDAAAPLRVIVVPLTLETVVPAVIPSPPTRSPAVIPVASATTIVVSPSKVAVVKRSETKVYITVVTQTYKKKL